MHNHPSFGIYQILYVYKTLGINTFNVKMKYLLEISMGILVNLLRGLNQKKNIFLPKLDSLSLMRHDKSAIKPIKPLSRFI